MIIETIINYQDCFIWAYKGGFASRHNGANHVSRLSTQAYFGNGGMCSLACCLVGWQVVECPTAMLEVEGSSLRFQSRLLTSILTSNVVVWLWFWNQGFLLKFSSHIVNQLINAVWPKYPAKCGYRNPSLLLNIIILITYTSWKQ